MSCGGGKICQSGSCACTGCTNCRDSCGGACNSGGACGAICGNGTCSAAGNCVGDHATTYYLDSDHDNYGDPSSSTSACSKPANYVSNNADCYDNNGSAHPGQNQFYTVHRGDGSFDYDCNGSIEYDHPTTVATCIACSPTLLYLKAKKTDGRMCFRCSDTYDYSWTTFDITGGTCTAPVVAPGTLTTYYGCSTACGVNGGGMKAGSNTTYCSCAYMTAGWESAPSCGVPGYFIASDYACDPENSCCAYEYGAPTTIGCH
jgi:hypothetical protein